MRRMSAVRSAYRRSEWYVGLRFNPVRDNIVSLRDEEQHNTLRLKMAAGVSPLYIVSLQGIDDTQQYSGKENDDLEGTIDRNIQALINLIREKYLSTDSQNKPMDFGRKAQYFTLDVISDVSYRQPFGYLIADSDMYDYISIVEKVFVAAILVTIFPWLNKILGLRIFKSALPSDQDPMGLGKLLGLYLPLPISGTDLLSSSITNKAVAERFGPNKKVRQDMLGSFISHGLNQEEAESGMIIQMYSAVHMKYLICANKFSTAGSDTTATAIRSTLLHLIMHPRIMSKLRAEISSTALSSPIQDTEARKMPYLQAVIKEGLRIFPPIVGLMSKEVPPGGDIIHNQFVPGGTKIGFGAWSCFRDTNAWGHDAETFRPERWLEASPEALKEMEATSELAFGYGRYQCLGKNLAMMELNKIFVEVNMVNIVLVIC